MPMMAPYRRPHTWETRIIPGDDGLYHGAEHSEGQLARGAVVHDDSGEAWGTVAWLHDRPQEWWLGRYPFYPEKGHPPVMGAAEIIFAADMGCDLLLLETPAAYVLRSTIGPWDGPAAVVLDWRRTDALHVWLSMVRDFICETPTLARAVKSLGAKLANQRLRIKVEVAESHKEAA